VRGGRQWPPPGGRRFVGLEGREGFEVVLPERRLEPLDAWAVRVLNGLPDAFENPEGQGRTCREEPEVRRLVEADGDRRMATATLHPFTVRRRASRSS